LWKLRVFVVYCAFLAEKHRVFEKKYRGFKNSKESWQFLVFGFEIVALCSQ